MDFEALGQFLTDLFDSTHSRQSLNCDDLIVVVLSPTNPTDRILVLLTQTQYSRRVQYFVGSAKSSFDLERIRIQDSIAVYIVADLKKSKSLREEEDSIFLSAMSVTKYLWHKLHFRTGKIDYFYVLPTP